MPVYFIAEIKKIIDREAYSKYVADVPKIIEKFGGKYLARDSETLAIFGDWKPGKIVMVKFDSFEHLHRCFNSPEYRAIAPLREESTIGKAFAVEGVETGEKS